jgi:hypothetical protein
MELGVEWQTPIELKDEKKEALIYNLDHSRLSKGPAFTYSGESGETTLKLSTWGKQTRSKDECAVS